MRVYRFRLLSRESRAGEYRLTTKIVKTLFDFHRGQEGVDRRTNSSGTNVSIVLFPTQSALFESWCLFCYV